MSSRPKRSLKWMALTPRSRPNLMSFKKGGGQKLTSFRKKEEAKVDVVGIKEEAKSQFR